MEGQNTTRLYYISFNEVLLQDVYPEKIYKRLASKKFKVLIIDNDSVISQVYKTKLIKEGFTVTATNDTSEGLRIAKNKQPDIILANIDMPDQEGFYLLSELKKDPLARNIPVISLTDIKDKDTAVKAYKFGAFAFLSKFDLLPKDLVKNVKEILNNN